MRRSLLGRGEPVDSLLPETFAVVREAGKRVLDMRHFDVQLVGGPDGALNPNDVVTGTVEPAAPVSTIVLSRIACPIALAVTSMESVP